MTSMSENYTLEIVAGMMHGRFLSPPNLNVLKSAVREATIIDPGGKRLWDLTCGLNISTVQLRELAEFQKDLPTAELKAAIVGPEDLTFGLIRMYLVFSAREGVSIRVFRTERDALTWLNE